MHTYFLSPPPPGRVGCTRWRVCGCTRCWSASLLWLESPSSARWPWCSLFSTHSEKSSTATSGTSHTQVHNAHNAHCVHTATLKSHLCPMLEMYSIHEWVYIFRPYLGTFSEILQMSQSRTTENHRGSVANSSRETWQQDTGGTL